MPFLVSEVQGLSGLALANAEPVRTNAQHTLGVMRRTNECTSLDRFSVTLETLLSFILLCSFPFHLCLNLHHLSSLSTSHFPHSNYLTLLVQWKNSRDHLEGFDKLLNVRDVKKDESTDKAKTDWTRTNSDRWLGWCVCLIPVSLSTNTIGASNLILLTSNQVHVDEIWLHMASLLWLVP